MTKTKVIRVFSFIMALALVFAMISTPAYAIGQRQFGAWIASALTALNITWNSTVAPYYQFLDYIADPFQLSEQGVVEQVPLTYERIDDILNQSTLSISGDTVTIDGIDYTDIWLSHDAAEKFRVNAFDIESAWDIASESEGTFVSGAGNIGGIPIYGFSQFYKSQFYSIPATSGVYKIGDVTADIITQPHVSNYTPFQVTFSYNGNTTTKTGNFYDNKLHGFALRPNSSTTGYLQVDSWTGSYPSGYFDSPAVSMQLFGNDTPFDFDWVSGIIPTDPLPNTDGLHLLVPSNPQQWSDDPDTQQVINNIQNFYQLNPDLSPGVDVDLDSPGIIDKLDDLLDIISSIIKLTKPSFGPQDSPTPPAPTGDLISNTPWSYLENLLNNIIQKLQDIINSISNIPSLIISSITSLQNTLSNILQDINDLLSDLVDNIVTGNANWFKDIVDSIWNPFQRIFAVFKAHIGIWHYVVDWLNNIRSPFTFFYGVLTGLGTLYTSPIFAAFAGILVIAIYRRFGR